MSIKDKFMKLLFKDYPDVEESSDIEETTVISEGKVEQYIPSIPLKEEKTSVFQQAKSEKETEVKEEKKTSFVEIRADDDVNKVNAARSQRQRNNVRESKRDVVREPDFGIKDDVYESVEVISPHYGRIVEEKEEEGPKVSKPKKTSRASTVISPMFGKVDQNEIKEKMNSHEGVSFQTSYISDSIEPEEESIYLDAMLSKDHEDDLDETTQISLFGNHISVHEQEKEMFEVNEEDEIIEDSFEETPRGE